ncbi:hypothetical protein T484DRAFT_3631625 [Baffinella frigidus]|nr:hypothetical protein T484DRAFT_3631625 [Cryptophyta sp. CCMP2293]
MFSIKTLTLAGAIAGATAFSPVSRSLSAPELRVAAPRMSTRGSPVTRSMSGDDTTTLARPARLRRFSAMDPFTQEPLTSFDAGNSCTINLDELKMALRRSAPHAV